MARPIIEVRDLSKRYRLGQFNARSLREETEHFWNSLVGRNGASKESAHDFQALHGVSFDVHAGEVLGVIGRNGAGKSTLLKVLSRITEPTSGEIRIRGRIASLLEVGTGFHPELTGRENVFLNGAILGMSRQFIKQKFDDIVEFAEVEKFIDTPVKRYSSGMYVRLAFAVAAHLEAEILLVDEVLAVGDAAFQKKCLGKMKDVVGSGRTVLFVSHNMGAVSHICSRGLHLESGTIRRDGTIAEAIADYLDALRTPSGDFVDLREWPSRYGPGRMGRLVSLAIATEDGKPAELITIGQGMKIRLNVKFEERVSEPEIGVVISTLVGQRVVRFVSLWEGLAEPVTPGVYEYQIDVPSITLAPGTYTLTPWLKHRRGESEDLIEGALQFTVVSGDLTGHSPYFELYCQPGEYYAKSEWHVKRLGNE